jgi:hypothetical protein
MPLWLRILLAAVIWMVVALIVVAVLQTKGSPFQGPPVILGTLAAGLFLVFARGSTNSQSAPLPVNQSAPLPVNQSAPLPVNQSAPLPVKPSAKRSPDLDTSAWATIKEYDKNVSQALKKITPLGEGWVVEFGNRIMAADPKVRDANEIAEQVVEEYQNSLKISEVEEINAAYAEVKSNFGKFGEAQFEKLYSLVGDAMDISKAMASIGSDYHAKLKADEQVKSETYIGYEDDYETNATGSFGLGIFIVVALGGIALIINYSN